MKKITVFSRQNRRNSYVWRARGRQRILAYQTKIRRQTIFCARYFIQCISKIQMLFIFTNQQTFVFVSAKYYIKSMLQSPRLARIVSNDMILIIHNGSDHYHHRCELKCTITSLDFEFRSKKVRFS